VYIKIAGRQTNHNDCRRTRNTNSWDRPMQSRNYQVPEALKGELQGIIDEMLRDKIFRHSSSLWNSPIILVKKKEDASQQEK